MSEPSGYWYLASYPKSGNTWCRIFISELIRLANNESDKEFDLNNDIETGSIISSRLWLDDQLGVSSCDLNYEEIDQLRSECGGSQWIYDESERFHKVHDAFVSPDSRGHPVVNTQGCRGAVYLLRNPEDVAVSLSHFYAWPLEKSLTFLMDPSAALSASTQHGRSQVRQHLGRWDQHIASWLNQSELPVLVMRYEDMHDQHSGAFLSLARFLELPGNPELVAQAREKTRFERLRQLEEKTGRFAESPKSCDTFFRSGRIGEGAEELTPQQRARLCATLGDTMRTHAYPTVDAN